MPNPQTAAFVIYALLIVLLAAGTILISRVLKKTRLRQEAQLRQEESNNFYQRAAEDTFVHIDDQNRFRANEQANRLLAIRSEGTTAALVILLHQMQGATTKPTADLVTVSTGIKAIVVTRYDTTGTMQRAKRLAGVPHHIRVIDNTGQP